MDVCRLRDRTVSGSGQGCSSPEHLAREEGASERGGVRRGVLSSQARCYSHFGNPLAAPRILSLPAGIRGPPSLTAERGTHRKRLREQTYPTFLSVYKHRFTFHRCLQTLPTASAPLPVPTALPTNSIKHLLTAYSCQICAKLLEYKDKAQCLPLKYFQFLRGGKK